MSSNFTLPQFTPPIFQRTFLHPVLGSFIEWVPAMWLLSISNPNPTDTTDLGDGTKQQYDMDTLLKHMLEHGMRDPFLVGVGRVTRRVRLEAGNHRVRVLMDHGIFWLPAVAYIGDSEIHHDGNGTHIGQKLSLNIPIQEDIMGSYPIKEYDKLSNVLNLDYYYPFNSLEYQVMKSLKLQNFNY